MTNKKVHKSNVFEKKGFEKKEMEASPGIEPGYADLQSAT